LQDLRGGHALVEFIKDEYLQRCSGFVAPGKTAREYLRAHKISDRLIFTAPNAIDNDFFTRAAAEARRKAPGLREELHLPDRYFLFVGRLVREKGVFELLSAYAKLDQQVRRQVGLVLAGDGTLRHQLQEQAASIFPGTVTFAGFVHREQLPVYYALAETLVLPTYSDTWGLVVNEAMACGLPVILSRAAGCAADLLIENRNGMLVSPRDVTSLANAMQSLACAPDLRANMAADSLRHIGDYSAAGWSVGVEGAVEAMGVNHD
jgi:glycosyltransferase involved in cell wall biosynthesis